MINIIAAIGKNSELGFENRLLCHLPNDLRHFKDLTTGHAVAMGSRTWDSLPKKPLPGRRNIVLTRSRSRVDGAEVARSAEDILEIAAQEEQALFIIGGAEVYKIFMPHADKLYLTKIVSEFVADVWFPEIDPGEWQVSDIEFVKKDEKNQYDLYFKTLTRKR